MTEGFGGQPCSLPAIVAEADLEAQLVLVRSAAAAGPAGIFGPHSVAWRLDREAAVFLGAGRPVMRKGDFAAAAKAQAVGSAPKFDGSSEIQEIKILGEWRSCGPG